MKIHRCPLCNEENKNLKGIELNAPDGQLPESLDFSRGEYVKEVIYYETRYSYC